VSLCAVNAEAKSTLCILKGGNCSHINMVVVSVPYSESITFYYSCVLLKSIIVYTHAKSKTVTAQQTKLSENVQSSQMTSRQPYALSLSLSVTIALQYRLLGTNSIARYYMPIESTYEAVTLCVCVHSSQVKTMTHFENLLYFCPDSSCDIILKRNWILVRGIV